MISVLGRFQEMVNRRRPHRHLSGCLPRMRRIPLGVGCGECQDPLDSLTTGGASQFLSRRAGAMVVKGRHANELLWDVGSSSRQFQGVRRAGGGADGTLVGGPAPECAGLGSHAGPPGRRNSPPDPGVGTGAVDGGGTTESGRDAAGLPGVRAQTDAAHARARDEPQGSGAMKSACRQCECRFHRPGQFWSQPEDEALMCLETFWRNGRWRMLFPPRSRRLRPLQKLRCSPAIQRQ